MPWRKQTHKSLHIFIQKNWLYNNNVVGTVGFINFQQQFFSFFLSSFIPFIHCKSYNSVFVFIIDLTASFNFFILFCWNIFLHYDCISFVKLNTIKIVRPTVSLSFSMKNVAGRQLKERRNNSKKKPLNSKLTYSQRNQNLFIFFTCCAFTTLHKFTFISQSTLHTYQSYKIAFQWNVIFPSSSPSSSAWLLLNAQESALLPIVVHTQKNELRKLHKPRNALNGANQFFFVVRYLSFYAKFAMTEGACNIGSLKRNGTQAWGDFVGLLEKYWPPYWSEWIHNCMATRWDPLLALQVQTCNIISN